MSPMSGAVNVRGRGVAPAVLALVIALFLALATGACGSSSGSGSSSTAKRPTTQATLTILAPEPNATVPPTFKLEFKLTGGRIVPAASTAVNGVDGHIHVSVDGQIVSM